MDVSIQTYSIWTAFNSFDFFFVFQMMQYPFITRSRIIYLARYCMMKMTVIMHQHPVLGNVVHVLGVDFEIIDVLRTRSGQFLDDAFCFAVIKLDAFAFIKLSGVDEVLAINRPERVACRAADWFGLVFDLKIDNFVGDMREGPRYDVSSAGLDSYFVVDLH